MMSGHSNATLPMVDIVRGTGVGQGQPILISMAANTLTWCRHAKPDNSASITGVSSMARLWKWSH
jgi:hypothetical protein